MKKAFIVFLALALCNICDCEIITLFVLLCGMIAFVAVIIKAGKETRQW